MINPWQHFKQYTKPKKISQAEWLLDCLTRNQYSAYGLHYQFAKIDCITTYQKQLPIINYEALHPWVDRLEAEDNILFTEPVIAFEKTGGSHSGGKLIPYSATGLQNFREALLPWLADLITAYQLNDGCAYWALSPATQKCQSTTNGIPIGGSDALYLGKDNLAAFMQLSAIPISVAQIQTLQEWQVVTLYYLIKRDDLRLISVWSPSFFLQLLYAIDEYQQILLSLFKQGGVIAEHNLLVDQAAAKRLETYLISRNTQQLWPRLAVLSCWTDASSAVFAKELHRYFSYTVMQPKGLLSTEAIITIPNNQGQNLLCLQSNFYEFLDKQGNIYLANELIINIDYQVIVTTNSGLYRYNTGDQVVCLGYQDEQPILQFIGRVGVVSDQVGEKLTESFVNHCLSELNGPSILTFDKAAGGYLLLVEDIQNQQIMAIIEQKLCHNPQYAYARKLNQLAPLTCQFIPQLSQHYIDWQLLAGRRLGDIKIPTLLIQDWRKVFIGR